MPFWVFFLTWAASMVVGELLRPKQQIDNAKPAGRGDFDFPTATEARSVTVIVGTVQLDAPNVVWWGDLLAQPIQKEAGKGGFMGMGHTKYQTVGHRYHAGMHLSLCHGPVELLELKADGRSFWKGNSTGGLITVDAESLFGGEDSGGGVAGCVAFLPGTANQEPDSYLISQLGSPIPAFRGIASLVWYGPTRTFTRQVQKEIMGVVYTIPTEINSGYLGTSTRIAPISPVVRRIPSKLGLGAAVTHLNGDANAAEFIYECITDPEWGMGDPVDMVDLLSFIACAQRLAIEGFGISAIWDNEPVGKIMEEVLRTIDGVCYQDYRTGKWTLKLARGGYDVASLPVLDETNILSLENYSSTALDETTNEVKVTYCSRAAGFKDRQVQAQDFSNIRYQDAVVSQTMNYPMITRDALASQVAARDLFALSTPMAKCDVLANRTAYRLSPGDVFILRWQPQDIDQVIMRVQKATPGSLTNGEVRLSCIQDVFALGQTLYGAPAPSGWVDPVSDPQPCAAQALLEMPFWVAGESRQVLALGARADALTTGAEIWTDEGAGYLHTGDLSPMTPTGLLTAPYSCRTGALDATGFKISGGSDLALLPGFSTNADGCLRGANLAYFPDTGEIASWTTAADNGDGSFTVAGVMRGVLDTVPGDHAHAARVWFLVGGGAASTQGSGGGSGTPGAPGANGRGYTWRGEWLATQAYLTDDTVGRNGSSYVALQPSTGQDPATATSYWGLMARKGADGSTGGGSGLSYVEVMAETFANLTAFTVSGGTWVAANNAVTQSNGSNASMFLRWNTPVHVDDGAVFEVEIRLPAAPSADARAGITLSDASSTPGGALDMCLHCSGTTTKISAINNNIAWYFDEAYGYGLNVWVKLRVVRRAGKYFYYINGTLATTKAFTSNAWSPTHVNLWTYGTTAEFRNMKVWNIPEPVLPA